MVDLKKIFGNSENVNIEVKAAQNGIPASIWETYSSFANTSGGIIILGIGENKDTRQFIPLGIAEPQKMISDIWNILNNRQKVSANILLEHHVYNANYEGLDYVIIEVPRADRRDRPIFVGTDMFKGSFKRNHEGDYHCDKEEVKAMLRDQSDTSADSLLLDKLSIDALNAESIKSYRFRFQSIRENHVWNKLPNDEFLMKIGAAKISDVDGKIHPTLGGLIFFGDYINIIDELPSYFLDYREKKSLETRWSDRVCSSDADWSGNVFDFYYRVIDRLTSDVKRPFILNEKLTRVDDTIIHKGLRECLANALIHADYYGRRGIVIDKEFRTITISNPGTFRIDINEAIAGGISDARNSRIFNMFSLINVGERSGIGLCDVYSAWKLAGFELPKIIESVDPDRVTLVLQIESAKADDECDIKNNITQGVTQATQGVTQATQDVTQDKSIEERILAVIKANSTVSQKQMAEEVGMSLDSIKYYIRKMRKDMIVAREGTSQKGKWIVLK